MMKEGVLGVIGSILVIGRFKAVGTSLSMTLDHISKHNALVKNHTRVNVLSCSYEYSGNLGGTRRVSLVLLNFRVTSH